MATQYFRDPKFWASSCNRDYVYCNSKSQGFQPSGSLIKTVLLHSGQDVGGGLDYPGTTQGFGRVDLSSVLLMGDDAKPFDLFIEDYKLSINQDRTLWINVSSCDYTTEQGFIKVTISW